MAAHFIKCFDSQIFAEGQQLAFDYHGIDLLASIVSVEVVDMSALKQTDETRIPMGK